ncbi:flagellar attachment zone protein 1-like [Palaemon carinicauda]|uniref:flagellar attachment zone protein 1-like n=1 Tax=Palaemon carinicauda TaxID=392227 RepID=UPI0035B63509
MFDDFLAKIHQETETGIDLENIREVDGEEAEDIDLSKDNKAISAINEDLDRANKRIDSLMVSLEKAEAQNEKLREELFVKTSVETGKIELKDNIAISAINEGLDRANKRIESLMESLEKAEAQNEKLREELLVKTSVETGKIESSDFVANLALIDDIERANKNIDSLMVSLEKAEDRNDQIRDVILNKMAVEKELENAHEEIRTLEKRLGRVTGDLKAANEKLLEKSDLEEYIESADKEIRTLWAELDSVKAENKRLKTENVCQKAALESELNAAVEEVYRIGTKLDAVLDENCKLKTGLLIKKDVVCDLEMAEEELEKLWKEIAGVKAENRRLKRDFSEERATKNMLVKADEKNKTLEEEIRNLTSVADEFAIYKEKYQDMMERNMNLEMELNHKNYAIAQLVDGLSQIHPELKELYHKEISGEQTGDLMWDGQLNRFALQETKRRGWKKN